MKRNIILENVHIYSNNYKKLSNILISHGKINIVDDISSIDQSIYNNSTLVRCNGRKILPGMIDTHVHFRTPGQEYKEDYLSGSMGACAGGITSVFDMPNTNPFVKNALDVDNKINIIKKIKTFVNYGLYSTIINESDIKKIDNHPHVCGIKLFYGCTFSDLTTDENLIKLVLQNVNNKIITFHSECNEIINANKKIIDSSNYKNHTLIRSKKACIESTKIILKLAEKYKKKVIIAHVSTPEEIDMIYNCEYAYCEVGLHHMLLNYEQTYDKFQYLGVVNPSIKYINDNQEIIKRIDKIDIIGSDHAPHTLEEKKKLMPGINGVQTSLRLLTTITDDYNLISRITSYNACKIFGIENKGQILDGYDADLVIIDNKKSKISKSEIKSKQKHTPFEGIECNKIFMTIVNGEIVFKDGEVIHENCPPGVAIQYIK